MTPLLRTHVDTGAFDRVRAIGLRLQGVEADTRYDGSPVLRLHGVFMAGLASHPSAERDTLVVRMSAEERGWLLEDAPETYYVTEYYRPHPVVLVRLSGMDADGLRDLLTTSRRLTLERRDGGGAHTRAAADPLCWRPSDAMMGRASPGRVRARRRL